MPECSLVKKNLSNLCESLRNSLVVDQETEECLIKSLEHIFEYLSECSDPEIKELLAKEILWSCTCKRFISADKVCLDLEEQGEIPPFLYSLPDRFQQFRLLLTRLGSVEQVQPMTYGNILKKLAYVCGDDYLNSNELCKALKTEVEFFKLLSVSASEDAAVGTGAPANFKSKLTGLYFVSTELKFEKSSSLIILDNSEQLNYILKLPNEKYLFNPSEKLFKVKTNEIKLLVSQIHAAQRPTLFSQKYEENYDFSLPEDPDSQPQQMLIGIECYYNEMFHDRKFHRSLARTISDKEARQASPKYLSIDHLQKVIEERFSAVKFKCVEHLETALSCNKQQKLAHTCEEKACYLTYETIKFATVYISKKHVKMPYFPLCLARTLQPILVDFNCDLSMCASLIASTASQTMSLLQLANITTESNILSVIKQQYVPSSGKFYADDISLLTAFDSTCHDVLVGDLCVCLRPDGVSYIYCEIVSIYKNSQYEFDIQVDDELIRIGQSELFVLENWKRVNEAVFVDPPSEIVHLERKNIRIRMSTCRRDQSTKTDEQKRPSEDPSVSSSDASHHEEEDSINENFSTDILAASPANHKIDNLMEADMWLQQAKCDLESAENDMYPLNGLPAYEWVCYKCYRAVEKTLRGFHCFKGNGNKLPATVFGNDLRRLLLGIETGVRDAAFKFCSVAGNESKIMQYPDFSRFEKANMNSFYTSSQKIKSEKALKYGKEVVDLVDEIMNGQSGNIII
jgi:HEPN domain-containing protein